MCIFLKTKHGPFDMFYAVITKYFVAPVCLFLEIFFIFERINIDWEGVGLGGGAVNMYLAYATDPFRIVEYSVVTNDYQSP